MPVIARAVLCALRAGGHLMNVIAKLPNCPLHNPQMSLLGNVCVCSSSSGDLSSESCCPSCDESCVLFRALVCISVAVFHQCTVCLNSNLLPSHVHCAGPFVLGPPPLAVIEAAAHR